MPRKAAAVWKDWKMLEEVDLIPDPMDEHYRYGPLGQEKNKQMLFDLLKNFSHHELRTVCLCRTQSKGYVDIVDAILRARVEEFYEHFCALFIHFAQEKTLRVRILKHKIEDLPLMPPDVYLDAIDDDTQSES